MILALGVHRDFYELCVRVCVCVHHSRSVICNFSHCVWHRKVCEPSVNRTVNLHPNLSDYNGRREASRCQVPSGISMLVFIMLACLLGKYISKVTDFPAYISRTKSNRHICCIVYNLKKTGNNQTGKLDQPLCFQLTVGWNSHERRTVSCKLCLAPS